MNRNKNSMYNAISALGLTLVNGLLAIVVTRLIIGEYGSDFNGLNSTANQIVNVLLIVEGGFTLASNVALFYPLTNLNYDKVNRVLSKTRRKFRIIGILFLLLGLFSTILFTFFVNSTLKKELVFSIMIMAVIPSAFNLYYATTYRVLLQAQQREYIINIISMFTIGLGHVGNIVLALFHGPIEFVRPVIMICTLANSFMIVHYVKKTNKFLKMDSGLNNEIIHGTKDVMIQKVTSLFYLSVPIIFLSISSTGGTILASVYAVYNNVFNMVKSLLRSIIDAPRLGLGQMLSESSREDVWNVFVEYQYVVFSCLFVVTTTAYILIMPFISLYTSGISDVNYYDETIALLMTLIAVFELVHIPAGHLINMSGEFKTSKNIQVISLFVLVICMTLMGNFWGIQGLLLAILIVAVLLAFLEIGYVHKIFFTNKVCEFLKLSVPLFVTGIVVCIFEKRYFPNNIYGITSFVINGFLLLIINTAILFLVSFIFNIEISKRILKRILLIFK